MALLELPARLRFDWLRDYGPHWEPGDTAFWLEPSTCDELAAWYAKYRPEETGFKEAAGLRIEIVPAPKLDHRAHYARQMQRLNQIDANLRASQQRMSNMQNTLFGRNLRGY